MDYKITFKKKRFWHGRYEKYFTFNCNGKKYKGYIMPHFFLGKVIVIRIWERCKFLGKDYSIEVDDEYAYRLGADGLIWECFDEMMAKSKKLEKELKDYNNFFDSIGE